MLSMRDCYRAAERHLYRYKRLKEDVKAYEDSCTYKADTTGGEGVKTSNKSDPSAMGGIRLADPPQDIKQKRDWAWAIETAWAELTHYDSPKAVLLEKYYGLNNRNGRAREDSLKVRLEIMNTLHISNSTFYAWRNECVDAVIYAAIQRGVLKPYSEPTDRMRRIP